MGLFKKIKKTAKRSLTVKGLVNNVKNVSGVGLLQRSKKARQIALVGAVGVAAFYAAPYAATLGKSALAKVGSGNVGGLLKKVYNPKMNGPGPAQEPVQADLQTQLYSNETDMLLPEQSMTTRRAGAYALGASPAGCAATQGSFDDVAIYTAFGVYILVLVISLVAPLLRKSKWVRSPAQNS